MRLTYCTSLLLYFLQLHVFNAEKQECSQVSVVENLDLKAFVSDPWFVHEQAVTKYIPLSRNYCIVHRYEIKEKPDFWGYTIALQASSRDQHAAQHSSSLCAYQQEAPSGKLAMAPCFLPKRLGGDFWVVAYDENDGYALLSGGQPTVPTGDKGLCRATSGKYDLGLWILLRTQNRDEKLITKVRAIARASGYDVSVLNGVNQNVCQIGNDANEDL